MVVARQELGRRLLGPQSPALGYWPVSMNSGAQSGRHHLSTATHLCLVAGLRDWRSRAGEAMLFDPEFRLRGWVARDLESVPKLLWEPVRAPKENHCEHLNHRRSGWQLSTPTFAHVDATILGAHVSLAVFDLP